MDYRDERDALRGRVENLEEELADARHELDATREELSKASQALRGAALATRGEPMPSAPRAAGERQQELSPAIAVGMLSFVAVIVGLIGLCCLTGAVVFAGPRPSPKLDVYAALTAVGAAAFVFFVTLARMEARRLEYQRLKRAAGWNVMQWATTVDVAASAALLVVATLGREPSPRAIAVGLATIWPGVLGIAVYFAFAPRAWGEKSARPSSSSNRSSTS
jgi:hypothetical protein